jgi:hypothetical protein
MLLVPILFYALVATPTPAPSPNASSPPAELLGQWESADRTAEGVGNILEFRSDGGVTQISASMAEADYRLVDDRLITTWKDLATGKVSEVETQVEFEGSNRFLERSDVDNSGDTWSERVGSAPAHSGSALAGQWCSIFLETLPAYREFKGGKMYNRLPVVVLRGGYTVDGGTMTVTIQNQPPGSYPFRIENGFLLIKNRNGTEKKYRRPETTLLSGY